MPADRSPPASRATAVTFRVTFLRQEAPPDSPPLPLPPGYRLRRLPQPQAEDFRRLYDGVGADHAWFDMHALPPRELAAFVCDPRVDIHVLTDGTGAEAGFFQLDFRRRSADGSSEIAHLGLLPAWRGRGLGRWLLDAAIRAAWRDGTRCLLVNTCTLDHPAALGNYLRAGFRVEREETRTRHGESRGWRR